MNNIEEYKKRITEEYSLIKEKGFIKYFLIVADLVNYCKNHGVMVGPGRGSVTGSVIAYLIGITDIDPVVHKTNFARFLNISRDSGSLPDIDIDFSDNKRDIVINRLKTLYGENNIAGVSTFLQIKDKQALKDVSKAFGVPYGEVNEFSKSIVDTLEEALETENGKEFHAKYPEVVRHAIKLKNQLKAYGQHPAAQIISDEDLTLGTRSNLANRKGNIVVGADMEDAEFFGLLKLDVLGLSALTIISNCLELIKENKNKEIDLTKIELNDKEIFEELTKGNSVGVFQFNTWAMTHLAKEMGIDNFNDMVAALALVRPGPMDSGMTTQYIERKKTGVWDRKHESYEEITKDTYGINIFQEQVLEIFTKIAGLDPGISEKIRKVVGKKRDAAEFKPFFEMFLKGCLEVGYFTQQEAEDFWEELQSYARYGFSKNHAVAYAKLSYDCAYLKTKYPIEFICASLTYGSEGQKHALVREAQRIGLSVIPPRIGVSHTKNWVVKENKLFVPFIECQGIGPKMIGTIQEYMDSCKSGFFSDTDKPIIKGKLKIILDDIGAFDNTLTENIDNYFDLGIAFNPKKMYPKLYKLLGQNEKANINDLLCGNIKNRNLVKLVKKKAIKELTQCNLCDIRKEAKAPIPMTFGMYNIFILDEYPSWVEDKHGKAMISDAAEKMLFPILKEYGYEKEDFCLSSLVKCKCKNPEIGVVKNCSRWLRREIERTEAFMVLAFGNTGIKMFKGEESGIQRQNGACEWNEEFGVYVVYCSSPVSALFHVDALEKFKEGIKVFNQKLIDLGGFE